MWSSPYLEISLIDEKDEAEVRARSRIPVGVPEAISYRVSVDWKYVKDLPRYLELIINKKAWELLYLDPQMLRNFYYKYRLSTEGEERRWWDKMHSEVADSSYNYIGFNKGTDAQNFLAFIEYTRPYGLETTVQELDNILSLSPDIQRQFRELLEGIPYSHYQTNEIVSTYEQVNTLDHLKGLRNYVAVNVTANRLYEDWEYVKRVAMSLKRIIAKKGWEFFYYRHEPKIDNPFLVRYHKGTDAQNFRAFIETQTKYGLKTTVQELDTLLSLFPEVHRQFKSVLAN